MKKFVMAFLILFATILLPYSVYPQNKLYLQDTSKAFTSVAKKAIPAVVYIKSKHNGRYSSSSDNYDNPYEYFHDEFFRRFFGQPNAQPQVISGSGAIVSKDGYILTNNHIIQDANNIFVVLNNGEEYEAKVIGSDPRTDLAVIKIEGKDFPYLSFGNSDDLEIGEWAIAIGSPFQFQATLTVGVISAKGRQNLKITDIEDFIQTDAAINPGNSGGPLLNLQGEVIGINTAIASQSGGYMGIGFAIPSNMAKHVMKEIIENGKVTRGHLGIVLEPIDKEKADALDLEKAEGVIITEVLKDSAAEKSGLKPGDVIIAYNNRPIKSMASFKNDIANLKPKDKISLTIIRNNKKKNIDVILGQDAESKTLSKEAPELGIEVSNVEDVSPEILKKWQYDPNIEGVIITSIKQGSIAHRSGLKPGMIIMQVNNQKIKDLSDFNKVMSNFDKKRHILLLVKYQNITRFITIRLK